MVFTDIARIVRVSGENFSGRTAFLTDFVQFPQGALGENAYLSEDPSASFTGLTATVSAELAAQTRSAPGLRADISACIGYLGNRGLLHRNPFTLSGGEQAMLGVAGALLSAKRRVAIDSTLEQLSPSLVPLALQDAVCFAAAGGSVAFSDNRTLEDCFGAPDRIEMQPGNGPSIGGEQIDYPVCPLPIELRSIQHSYNNGTDVLRGVCARLEPGKVYHLRGVNGAGKSTLARILAGLLKPASGEVVVNGAARKLHHRPAELFAYHFQNPDHQLFRTTAYDEVAVCLGKDGGKAARCHLEQMGLSREMSTHPLDLPFVLRKRLALAATFAMRRPWMILDEPTLGQDEATTRKIVSIIQGLARRGVGILVISHSSFIRSCGEFFGLELRDGRLI